MPKPKLPMATTRACENELDPKIRDQMKRNSNGNSTAKKRANQETPRNHHTPMDRQKIIPIGTAARAAGLSTKMVRHYESIGLLPPAARGPGDARAFSEVDVNTLRFIGRARSLGFPLRAVRELISLWQDPHRSNADTLRLAQGHARELSAKRAQLESMNVALQKLMDACSGDGRPECPILDELADPSHVR